MSQINLEKKKYLRELISNQLKNIQPTRRLLYKDLCRISKYIDSSIFDENECCLWNGYITNSQNMRKGTYINFFFRNKKVALHRLLYENFVGALSDDYYLKFSCDDENKGKCCNINHMIKYKYNSNNESESGCESECELECGSDSVTIKCLKENFTIRFD
jgi:hypothetical protein